MGNEESEPALGYERQNNGREGSLRGYRAEGLSNIR